MSFTYQTKPSRYLIPCLLILSLYLFSLGCRSDQNRIIESIQLPNGFSIESFVPNIPNARAMALGDKGTLFVGTREEGKVYAVILDGKNKKNNQVLTIASGLNMPVGVAFKNGHLYVSEVYRILRFDNIEQHLNNPPKPVVINDSFPRDEAHGWKFIAFGPDNKLYVPVGAPCNICLKEDSRYASIMRMEDDGSHLEVYAHGVRNTVGFDWHPKHQTLWFTDNGRDWMGDDLPPDELNHAPKAGLHFGYPFCHGGTWQDPKFGHLRDCKEFTPPVANLGPHVAALGMRFYTGKQFPKPYHNKIFIAEHGSWNRSAKIGYRITVVDPDKPQNERYSVFADGWLKNEKTLGRPVDVLIMPDGSLLVSDDYAGAIYRIFYTP